MVWGAMSSAGVGPLCFLRSKVNAAVYQEVLEHFMLPAADQLYADADFIFQQDLAPAHSAKATSTWFKDHGIPVLNWTANSPDLNPIENLWDIMKRKMRYARPNNAEELKATIRATWALITPEQCHRLIDSMPRRIAAVIQAKGAPTNNSSVFNNQVSCVDWRDLSGKGYVVLNMSDNIDCDEFRVESGDRLLELLETAFSKKMNSPQGSWLISLSKPTRQDHQLLITLAGEHGVINSKDVLSMLGEIRRGLHEIGIQNYSSAGTCHSRPSHTRSDYGKLFVVLVIIGSVCVVIIAFGLIYICWQRHLPKMKTMTRAEELHFVENGCHDNPTLDVTGDGGQPEMLEKKKTNNQSTNGLALGNSGWQVLVNKPGGEEEDSLEEDTHL
uniref:Tc1-like transposase DDE domain-containing protein n=1 Tax=Esox lucius TaxID=8010 RepID=A0A6Q2XYW8_ESOLU